MLAFSSEEFLNMLGVPMTFRLQSQWKKTMKNGDGPFDVHFDPNVFGCCHITTAITILGQKTSYEWSYTRITTTSRAISPQLPIYFRPFKGFDGRTSQPKKAAGHAPGCCKRSCGAALVSRANLTSLH